MQVIVISFQIVKEGDEAVVKSFQLDVDGGYVNPTFRLGEPAASDSVAAAGDGGVL